MTDRHLIFAALVITVLGMLFLVVSKGCTGSDTVIIRLGDLATGLAGGLLGVSRASSQGSIATTTSTPDETVTKTEPK